LADLNETNVAKIDLTISDFRASGCAWCHPGGSTTEYDRQGYRFDGKPGLFSSGANPSPKAADYKIAGLVATTTDASSYCKAADCSTGTVGAGYFEVTAVGASLNNPEDTINQGTLVSAWDPVAGAWKTVGKKYASAVAAGSGEADCLMCHLGYQYSNLERNWAFAGATSPKLGASLGLVGAGQGTVGLLNIAAEGTSTTNPNVAPTGWTWNQFWGAASSIPGSPVTLRAQEVQKAPRNENCALCHFPDKSMAGTTAVTGPAGKPLGYTAFQKVMPPGSARDGDERPGVAGKDGNNDLEWKIAKGRVEGGKRGESINDPNNRDAHMKWGSSTPAGAKKMLCVDCHYSVEGTFAAVTDPAPDPDVIVQPNVTVGAGDHMFAKGDNAPDGKNMDQLDNTVTCEGCHVSRTHPKAGSARNPATAHAGFPPSHFEKLSCKACHITSLNSAMNQDLADFTVGPFRTFERTQVTEAPTGTNRRPLYMWRQAEHGQGHWEIQPFDIMTVAAVANATTKNAEDEATAVVPTFQRLGKRSAELLRAAKGDADGNGVYDWPLNAPQGGDTTLIVNKPDEIADFFAQVAIAGGASAPANPVLHFYFNQFTLSHNVVPKAGNPVNGRYILGSPAGGGCVMCHSDSSHPVSVGFFDRDVQLFAQPTDGGAGLVQTSLPAAAPLAGNLERVSVKFPYSNPLASGTTLPASFAATALSTAVDLSNVPGQTVGSSVNQGTLLGYGVEQLAILKSPGTGSFTILASANAGGTITDGSGQSAIGTRQISGLTSASYAITPSYGYRLAGLLVNGLPVPVSASGTAYTFSRVTANQIIAATFAPATMYTLTVNVSGDGGRVTTIDTEPDFACQSGTAGGCTASVPQETTVRLVAAPIDPAVTDFVGWLGCSADPVKPNECTVTMSNARAITASFKPKFYKLTAWTWGYAYGTVTSTDTEPDIACTTGSSAGCSGDAARDSTITLTAAPTDPTLYAFTQWANCTPDPLIRTKCTVTMSAARTVIASFGSATYLVTVKTAGTGAGTVTTTETEPDISCTTGSSASCTGSGVTGNTIRLMATPADGSTFAGWSGCTPDPSKPAECTVTVLAQKLVTAKFDAAVAGP
jgi:hypothetical protein